MEEKTEIKNKTKKEEEELNDLIKKVTSVAVKEVIKNIKIENMKKSFQSTEKERTKIKNDDEEKKNYIKKVEKYLDDYYYLKHEILNNLEQLSDFEVDDSIKKSKIRTKNYCLYIENILNAYLANLTKRENDRFKDYKLKIVNEIYLGGMSKKAFAEKYYGGDSRFLRRKINSLLQELSPYFFGVIGI